MKSKKWKGWFGFALGIAIACLCGMATLDPVDARSLSELLNKETIAPTQIDSLQTSAINPNGFIPKLLQQSDQPSNDRGVIGEDQRRPMLSREYHWSTVGKLKGLTESGDEYSCTGTLIGESLVLTNAHCVYDQEKLVKKMIFLPNLINGRLRKSTDWATVKEVFAGTKNPDKQSEEDWAILKLNKPLGQKYGFLKWRSLSLVVLQEYNKKLSVAGYSGDYPDPKLYADLQAGKGETAGVHSDCSVIGEREKMLVHDCDTNPGASGSALIGKIDGTYQIVALHAAGRKNRLGQGIENYAVEIGRIETKLSRDK